MNLVTIASAWYQFIHGSDSVRRLMETRLAKCTDCPYKKQLSKAGKLIIQAIHEEGSVYKCGLCNCPLATMTASPASKCKAGRW